MLKLFTFFKNLKKSLQLQASEHHVFLWFYLALNREEKQAHIDVYEQLTLAFMQIKAHRAIFYFTYSGH